MNLENLSTNADHFFLVVVAMLIFFMQVAIKSSSWLKLAFTHCSHVGPHSGFRNFPLFCCRRSPFGPHFEKFRSLFHVGAVHVLYLLKGKRKVNVEPLSSFLGLSPQVREEAG